jgi:Flp pilus assembly protein TadD
MNRWEESIDYLKELVEGYPDDAKGWSQLGTNYMQSNKTALAREAFERGLEADPNNTMILQNYG